VVRSDCHGPGVSTVGSAAARVASRHHDGMGGPALAFDVKKIILHADHSQPRLFGFAAFRGAITWTNKQVITVSFELPKFCAPTKGKAEAKGARRNLNR
jgi:hypothetical protein